MAKDHVVNINKGLALAPKRIGGSGSPSKIYPDDTITWKSHVDVRCWVTDFNPPGFISHPPIMINPNGEGKATVVGYPDHEIRYVCTPFPPGSKAKASALIEDPTDGIIIVDPPPVRGDKDNDKDDDKERKQNRQ